MSAPNDLFTNPRRVDALADLLANVWQLGYVTTDLDRGMEFMADRFGLTDCRRLPSDTATRPLARDLPAPARGHRVLHGADHRERLTAYPNA